MTDIRQPWLWETAVRDYLGSKDLVGYIGTHKITLSRGREPEAPTDAQRATVGTIFGRHT